MYVALSNLQKNIEKIGVSASYSDSLASPEWFHRNAYFGEVNVYFLFWRPGSIERITGDELAGKISGLAAMNSIIQIEP